MRRWVVATILAGAGCADDGASPSATTGEGDADSVDTPSDVPAASDGGAEAPLFTVRWDAETLTLALMRDATPLLRFPADGFQWAVVDALDDELTYNPMYPIDAQWHGVIAGEEIGGAALTVRLGFHSGGHALLTVDETAPGRFAATLRPEADAPPVAAFRFRPRTDPGEGFYGLGEAFDTPTHRGTDRPMQLDIDLGVDSSINEVHVPIPFLIGTTGWGFFVEDMHAARFEVATQEADLVQATFGTGPHSPDGIAFHLFAAEHPLDVTAHYHAVTGEPARPAPWALGPWIWRNENTGQAQVEADVRMLRELDLATSAMWIDRPYATGVNTFDFDATRYTDAAAMVKRVQDLGFRVAVWHTPYVSDMDEPSPQLNVEAQEAGYFPPVNGPLFNAWGIPIDLTNPAAFDWWQALIGRYADIGIEGYKLDYGEDVAPGAAERRLPWLFADGSDERTMHARYQLFYHRAYAEMLPADGGFLLCRSATYGDQTQASVIWPGDLAADLSTHRERVDGRSSVGGLPAAVSAGLSLGPSGFPLFASDTGGYRHAPPSKETMARWLQHTALTPVMQIGTASSELIWEFEDAELTGWYRDLTRLHLRLFPYLWTYVNTGGRPIMRAVGLAFPELGLHPWYDYLLGDHLLVAPVVRPGERTREVVFPPGAWIDWFDGTRYEGGGPITVDAPLSKLPLFLRDGAIVPMLRPTIDTLSPTTMPGQIDSYATTAGVLYARVFPGSATRFDVFDGSIIEQERNDGVIDVRVRGGAAFVDGALLELVGVSTPMSVRLDGGTFAEVPEELLADAEQGWAYASAVSGTLHLRIPPGEHTVVVTLYGG